MRNIYHPNDTSGPDGGFLKIVVIEDSENIYTLTQAVRSMISKQSLAVALSRLRTFAAAKPGLEQYPTESNLAAELLWEAYLRTDLCGRVVDLGSGTGILAIGAAILGAHVVAVEKDPEAVKVLRENIELYEGVSERLSVHDGDVRDYREPAACVLMNPPFGTQELHADRLFLERAFELAPRIYSIHKSVTESFLHRFASEHDFKITWQLRRKLPLKQTMAHHTKKRAYVEVTLCRFEKTSG
jgi:putative methylase